MSRKSGPQARSKDAHEPDGHKCTGSLFFTKKTVPRTVPGKLRDRRQICKKTEWKAIFLRASRHSSGAGTENRLPRHIVSGLQFPKNPRGTVFIFQR